MAIGNILIIDDEDIIRDILKDFLEEDGYNVTVSSSGEEALELTKSQKFDLVVTDLKMPGMDGIEVVKKFKSSELDTTVIMMTAYSTIDSAISALKEGAYDYITKPFDLDEIKFTIQRALERQFLLKEAKKKEYYRKLSILDGLTEVYNHRYFHEILGEEIEKARKENHSFFLFMIDIDNFKVFNDKNGHISGDVALKRISKILFENSKNSYVFRYGGEEFSMIFLKISKDEVFSLARHLKNDVEKTIFEAPFLSHLTISIGISEFTSKVKDKDEVISKADKALYKAKELGKNKICYWEGEDIVEI